MNQIKGAAGRNPTSQSNKKERIFPFLGDTRCIHIKPMIKEEIKQFIKWANNPCVQQTFVRNKHTFKASTLESSLKKMYTLDKPSNIYYSVYLGNKHIGRVKLQDINWESGSAYTSTILSTSKSIRGKGYGTESTRLLIELAKKLGIKTLYGKIHEDNIPNLRIYNKLSFKEVGKLSNYVVSSGKPVGVLLLEKHL